MRIAFEPAGEGFGVQHCVVIPAGEGFISYERLLAFAQRNGAYSDGFQDSHKICEAFVVIRFPGEEQKKMTLEELQSRIRKENGLELKVEPNTCSDSTESCVIVPKHLWAVEPGDLWRFAMDNKAYNGRDGDSSNQESFIVVRFPDEKQEEMTWDMLEARCIKFEV